MSILIRGMEMPKSCTDCRFLVDGWCYAALPGSKEERIRTSFYCPLVEVPPHGDLIDRDALIKDGWLSLYKEVMRMGGYAIHELPLKNPSIPVIIPAEGGEA